MSEEMTGPIVQGPGSEEQAVWPIMRDAAFPGNLLGWGGPIAGYYGGPNAYNVWSREEWGWFSGNRKLPIWVAGLDGEGEGAEAVAALTALKVPLRAYTVVDMEDRADVTYLEKFGAALNAAGYKVWVYGSAGAVFNNPPLNGYWVADYAGVGPFMAQQPRVRATQYASGPLYDYSTIKPWLLPNMWL